MYQGITFTPVISKLFEAVLLSIYGSYLNSDPLQFGFKKDSGCNHALFTFLSLSSFITNAAIRLTVFFLTPAKPLIKC